MVVKGRLATWSRLGALLALASVELGCATQESVYFSPLNAPPRALRPRPPGSVEVFQYARLVGPMIEIGVIEVRPADDPTRVFNRLRAEAGQMGCDGLLILPGAVRIRYGATVEEPANRAVCVVYPAPRAPAPPAPPPQAPAGTSVPTST